MTRVHQKSDIENSISPSKSNQKMDKSKWGNLKHIKLNIYDWRNIILSTNENSWKNYKLVNKAFRLLVQTLCSKESARVLADSGLIESCIENIFRGKKEVDEILIGACHGGHKNIALLSLRHGATNFNKGLCMASRHGHLELIELMIYQGAEEMCNAIHEACRGNHLDIFYYIVDNYGNIDAYNHIYDNALGGAYRGNNHSLAEYILTNYESQISEWFLILKAACQGGNNETVKFVLEKSRQRYGGQAWYLLEALEAAGYQAGKSFTQTDRDNIHCLIEATDENDISLVLHGICQNGKHRSIQYKVIEYLTQQDNFVWDLDYGLNGACIAGDIELAKNMISRGATGVGWAYSFACNNRLDDIGIVKFLISCGVDDLSSGLSQACYSGKYNIADFLIDAGADNLNECLTSACLAEELDIITLLINRGANTLDDALAVSCRNSLMNVCDLLLSHGATHCSNCNNKNHIFKLSHNEAY